METIVESFVKVWLICGIISGFYLTWRGYIRYIVDVMPVIIDTHTSTDIC